MSTSPRFHKDGERGSTIPLMIGFFLIAGLLLTAGVVAASAFLQLRSLQSACDGAAIAASNGFGRGESALAETLTFDAAAAQQAAAGYAVQAWGGEVDEVALEVLLEGDVVIVRCTRTAHVPFESVVSPGGIAQTVTASSRAPLRG